MEWIAPGVIISGVGLVILMVGKILNSIKAIKQGAVSGANLDHSLVSMKEQITGLQKEMAAVKKILTNGLSSTVSETKQKVSALEETYAEFTDALHTAIKELAEMKVRCEERTRWADPRSAGRRGTDNDFC